MTVDFLIFAINLVHGKVMLAVDLPAGGRAVLTITGDREKERKDMREGGEIRELNIIHTTSDNMV